MNPATFVATFMSWTFQAGMVVNMLALFRLSPVAGHGRVAAQVTGQNRDQVGQRLDETKGERPLAMRIFRFQGDLQSSSDGGQGQWRFSNGGQGHKIDTLQIGCLGGQVVGGLHRQTAFAHAARPQQREQTAVFLLELGHNLFQFGAAPDEGGQESREVTQRGGGRPGANLTVADLLGQNGRFRGRLNAQFLPQNIAAGGKLVQGAVPLSLAGQSQHRLAVGGFIPGFKGQLAPGIIIGGIVASLLLVSGGQHTKKAQPLLMDKLSLHQQPFLKGQGVVNGETGQQIAGQQGSGRFHLGQADGAAFGLGVIVGSNGRVTLTNAVFSLNSAYAGGAIANNGADAVIIANDTETSRNTANTTHGGGVLNQNGALIFLIRSHVYGNQAAGHGGGLANGVDGSVNISGTVLENNEAGSCGGFYTAPGSQTTIKRSAILGNTADHSGGAMLAQGTLEIYNSTLSGNFAIFGGGMLVWPLANVTAVNVTIAANASVGQNGVGLLQAGGHIAIGNSLLDNLGGNCYQSDGTSVSLGHNLSGDDSCLFTEAGDLNDVDPLLAELENGVHHLQPGSPAIDAGDAALCAETLVFNLDQLGQERPKFNGCDIGAVEWQGFDLYLPVIIR
jgi:hypothetical protein